MFIPRFAAERGHFDHGWLDTHHTFSFGDYHDPAHHHFRALRVMNEDRIAAGQGFGMHPHRDMEIVTYVLSGELEHRDSLGNGEILRAGELQRMTAGSGIVHSEFNPSSEHPVHLYQVWLLPRQRGLLPSYAQRPFPRGERLGVLTRVAGPEGNDDALIIQQDASIYLGAMARGQSLRHELAAGRGAWVQVVDGQIRVGEIRLGAGDGVALTDESAVDIRAESLAEVMLFDLP